MKKTPSEKNKNVVDINAHQQLQLITQAQLAEHQRLKGLALDSAIAIREYRKYANMIRKAYAAGVPVEDGPLRIYRISRNFVHIL